MNLALAAGLLTSVLGLPPRVARAEEHAHPVQVPGNAAIVLVSKNPADELLALVSELLNREAIGCELARTSRFDVDELFARRDSDSDVRVFIRVEPDKGVRLYFRGPLGERFLLRKVELAHGLDAVGRELVAQVVESSVVALLRSSVGLSREQASVEVARESPLRADSPPAPSPTPPPARREPSRAREPNPPSPLLLLFSLRYSLQFSGPDLYPVHGPGLELGLGLRKAWLLRVRLSAERLLPQKLRVTEVTASVHTSALRASFDLGVPLGPRESAVFALGGGVDIAQIDVGAPHLSDVDPAETQADIVPVIRSELRYEAVRRPLLLAVSMFADLALLDTHYDLVDRGFRQRLATPWKLRPGAALLAGFAW